MGQIEFRSETGVSADGATVEVGTVTFNGRDFAALGSVYSGRNSGAGMLVRMRGGKVAS